MDNLVDSLWISGVYQRQKAVDEGVKKLCRRLGIRLWEIGGKSWDNEPFEISYRSYQGMNEVGDGKRRRCLCGAVSFEFSGAENWRAHCHCESCRRNTSSPFTTWFGVPNFDRP